MPSVRGTFADGFAKACDHICKKHSLTPVFVPMQYSKDKNISLEIISKMQTKAYFADSDLDVDTIMGIVSMSEAAFAVRLHMLLFGAATGVPVLGVNYDPKVESNINELGIGECIQISELGTEAATKKCDAFFDRLEEIKAKIPQAIEQRKQMAQQNADIAAKILERK